MTRTHPFFADLNTAKKIWPDIAYSPGEWSWQIFGSKKCQHFPGKTGLYFFFRGNPSIRTKRKSRRDSVSGHDFEHLEALGGGGQVLRCARYMYKAQPMHSTLRDGGTRGG